MKLIIRFLSPLLVAGARLYWYLFRPITYGVKIILTSKSEVLMVKHTYGKKWTFPGGGIKHYEKNDEAVKREVFEELGIILPDPVFLGEFVSTAEYKRDTISVYTALIEKEKIMPVSFEIDCVAWYPIDSLPKLGPVSDYIVEMYKKHIIKR